MKFGYKLKTVNDAINANAPSIAAIHREKGREFTESLVMVWLVYLNAMLNLKKPMHEEQIILCASEVVNEFYMLNFADLTIFFRRILSGSYGKFYESLAISDVLTFFRSYLDERLELAADESLRRHNDIKSDQTFNQSNNLRRNWDNLKNTNG